MPNIVNGNTFQGDSGPQRDYGYTYPFGLDLKPGSELHNKILQKLIRFADESSSVMSKRWNSWNDIDRTLKVWIPISEAESKIVSNDYRKPISMVVPYSYVTLETILAYMMRAFLSDNIFQYEGNGPEDTIPAKLLELVVNQQVRRFKSILDIYASLRDCFAYGIGVSTLNWKQCWGMKPQIQDVPQFSKSGLQLPSISTKQNVKALLFEGNEVINIDPYRILPDPNCSIHNVQAMEHIGWIDFLSRNRLLQSDQLEERFNVKYIPKGQQSRASKYAIDNSRRILSREERSAPVSTDYITLVVAYAEIIPKDWGLPGALEGNEKGEYPEKWMFEMANEQYITKCQPLGLNHNMYPVAIAAPDFDGYSITPLARMELISGLQTALNFMFNSHVANVRKAINDTLIVDPSLVNMEDLKNPEPGKLVRLRRQAWGRGVDQAVKQLTITDITQGNMRDADTLMGMMSRATAASDSVQGIIQDRGERTSASEFNGTMQMAVSRLDRIARLISTMYLQDLAYFHASHTQQLMSQNTFVKAVGDWPQELAEEFGQNYGKQANVSPFDIIADFDVIFKDGTTKTMGQTELAFWTTSFNTIANNQYLMQTFDVARIFAHAARMSGATNINDFFRRTGGVPNVQTSPMADEQVAGEVQKGNLVSMEDFMQGRMQG
jgi:hypothetical protein